MLIYNARLLGGENGWLSWEAGKITALGHGDPPSGTADSLDAGGLILLPGFIDIHIHGCAGYDVMDATSEALTEMARFLAQHGVTSFLPTTLTDTHERLLAALRNIQTVMESSATGGAAILGAHLEGPYLNQMMAGAQNPQYIRRAESEEAKELLDLGVLRLVDIAPEYEENLWLVSECTQRGIIVSMAHTAASYEQVLRAVDLGLSHATHTYNAMSPLRHRAPGAVGAALSQNSLTCELIADNIHVHPSAIQILWMTKRPLHLILISDAVRPAGMPEGEYDWDSRRVLLKDGAVRLPDGTLSGSVLTLDVALRNFLAATLAPLEESWQVSSANAARQLKLPHKGTLTPDADADLVLLDEACNVQLTVVEGEIVFRA
jgi:N-acetylglucosamine-6-phosphate deacetylase